MKNLKIQPAGAGKRKPVITFSVCFLIRETLTKIRSVPYTIL